MERMAAQYPHEWTFMWLASILRQYTRRLGLGTVLGSRTPVRIHEHAGRLPDILFVSAERSHIIAKDAIYGPPDLVIEIVSPADRPSEVIGLETDYRTVGVPEIVFIDPQNNFVRVVRRADGGYLETTLISGRLEFQQIRAFWLEVEWLFAAEQPDELTITNRLVADSEGQVSP